MSDKENTSIPTTTAAAVAASISMWGDVSCNSPVPADKDVHRRKTLGWLHEVPRADARNGASRKRAKLSDLTQVLSTLNNLSPVRASLLTENCNDVPVDALNCADKEREYAEIPLDWTIKQQVDIECEFVPDFILRNIPSVHFSNTNQQMTPSMPSLRRAWAAALTSWQFPPCPLPSVVQSQQGGVLSSLLQSKTESWARFLTESDQSVEAILARRRLDWIEAVHSAGDSIIQRQSKMVYIQSDQWLVLLDAQNTEPRIACVDSGGIIRSRLKELCTVTGCKLPAPAHETTCSQTQVPDSFSRVQTTREQHFPLDDSLLVLDGEFNVRMGLEVLVEYITSKTASNLRRDVPLIVSETPFVFASARRLHVTGYQKIGVSSRLNSCARHRVSIRGVILNENLRRLCEVLDHACRLFRLERMASVTSSVSTKIPSSYMETMPVQEPARLSLNPFKVKTAKRVRLRVEEEKPSLRVHEDYGNSVEGESTWVARCRTCESTMHLARISGGKPTESRVLVKVKSLPCSDESSSKAARFTCVFEHVVKDPVRANGKL